MHPNTQLHQEDLRRISLFGSPQEKAWLKSKLYQEAQFELLLKQERLRADKQRDDEASQQVEFHRRQLQLQAQEREGRRKAQLRATQQENLKRASELEQMKISQSLRRY
mmetsp:Transcript_14030/g.26275  ORF Transcript_14030/g.26275 Transcript_14030/m.26275 type:complete len:109 (-) Transcript_14030:2007-2333(-)